MLNTLANNEVDFADLEVKTKLGNVIEDRKLGIETSAKLREIVNKLPPDFIEKAKDNYLDSVEQNKIYGKTSESLEAVVAGFLFEELVRAEFQSEPEDLANEILDVLHSPRKYKFMKGFGHRKNPDVSYIKMDEETHAIKIVGAGECKLGKLDGRAYEQLTSFKRNFEDLSQHINNTDIEQTDNVAEIINMKKSGRKLEVSEEFEQYLYIPKQKGTISPYALFSNNMEDGTYESLAELFRGDKPKVRIKQSSFDSETVAKLTRAITEMIEVD